MYHWAEHTDEINDILQKRRVHVQEYFPPMGKETADYRFHIEKFIKELPS